MTDKPNNIMQVLNDARLNPFGAVLLAESLLRSPVAEEMAERAARGEVGHVKFFMPINRGDCPGWAGVYITLQAQKTETAGEQLLRKVKTAAANALTSGGAGVMGDILRRAQGHPSVLEIMADCADCIDTENSAQYDPEAFGGRPYDVSDWVNAARELRAKATAIRAEDPEIWADTSAPPTAESHPFLYKAGEELWMDQGAPHHEFAAAWGQLQWPDVDAAERELATLTQDELQTFCGGEYEEVLTLAKTRPHAHAAVEWIFENIFRIDQPHQLPPEETAAGNTAPLGPWTGGVTPV